MADPPLRRRSPLRVRCAATTLKGTPCQAWAVRHSKPPRCVAHLRSAPTESECTTVPAENDVTDITQYIVDLADQIRRLSQLIRDTTLGDEDATTISIAEYRRLVALHGALCSRLSRMLRDRQQLQGDEQTDLDQAIQEALDMAGDILGVKL
jgi:hypothetical protein